MFKNNDNLCLLTWKHTLRNQWKLSKQAILYAHRIYKEIFIRINSLVCSMV